MSLSNKPCKSVSKWCCKKLPLYTDVCTNTQADGLGKLLVNVYTDSIIGTFGSTQVNVETSIDVYITIFGDTTNDISGLITIPAGQSYGSDYYIDFAPFENIVNITIDLISPSGSTTQTYLPGYTTFTGSCSIPPTPTPTPTITPTNTLTPTITPTNTVTPTNTQTPTPSSVSSYFFCMGYDSTDCGLACSDYTNCSISPTPTNTQTPTPTNTVTPTNTRTPTPSAVTSYFYCMGYDSTDCGLACSDYSNCNNDN